MDIRCSPSTLGNLSNTLQSCKVKMYKNKNSEPICKTRNYNDLVEIFVF
jgi:hypothetical protein